MKGVKLTDLFTAEDITAAIKIMDTNTVSPAREIEEEVVMPKMAHINQVTGQENNSMYMAYMLMDALR